MFTAGFRFFGLLSLMGLVGAIGYGISTADTSGDDYLGILDTEILKGVFSLGWEGGVGQHLGYVIFIFLALTALGLAIVMVLFRDADPQAVAQLEGLESAPEPSSVPANINFWPVVMAFGMAIILVGLITNAAVFIIGIILATVAILEWTVFAWSERLTGDPAVNRQIRNRLMAPIEIPVLGAAGAAILALGASRIFLAVSEANAVWAGTAIAAVIFLSAIYIAAKPRIPRAVIASLLVLGAVGIIAAGIASAAIGSREIHTEEHSESAVEESAVELEAGHAAAGENG